MHLFKFITGEPQASKPQHSVLFVKVKLVLVGSTASIVLLGIKLNKAGKSESIFAIMVYLRLWYVYYWKHTIIANNLRLWYHLLLWYP